MVKKKWMILGALVLSLFLAGVALASGSPSLDWWVIGGGGANMTTGSTSLDSTIGQWVVGSDETGGIQLGPGFWGGGWDETHDVFLPLVLRDSI